jgi:hypothetical protein
MAHNKPIALNGILLHTTNAIILGSHRASNICVSRLVDKNEPNIWILSALYSPWPPTVLWNVLSRHPIPPDMPTDLAFPRPIDHAMLCIRGHTSASSATWSTNGSIPWWLAHLLATDPSYGYSPHSLPTGYHNQRDQVHTPANADPYISQSQDWCSAAHAATKPCLSSTSPVSPNCHPAGYISGLMTNRRLHDLALLGHEVAHITQNPHPRPHHHLDPILAMDIALIPASTTSASTTV